jgi:hypothetical protein
LCKLSTSELSGRLLPPIWVSIFGDLQGRSVTQKTTRHCTRGTILEWKYRIQKPRSALPCSDKRRRCCPSVICTSDVRSLSLSLASDLEAKPKHAALVLVYRRKAVLLGVGGLGEEHALVTLRLLFLAYAAGLCLVRFGEGRFGGFARTLGLEASAFRGAACAAGALCPRDAVERTGE